jgi:hypothetical protein
MGTREIRQAQAWLVGSDKRKSEKDPKAGRKSDCLIVRAEQHVVQEG